MENEHYYCQTQDPFFQEYDRFEQENFYSAMMEEYIKQEDDFLEMRRLTNFKKSYDVESFSAVSQFEAVVNAHLAM